MSFLMSPHDNDTHPSPASKIQEPLLPQWSIRSFLLLFVFAAIAMWVIRSAVVYQWLWAKCVSVVLVTAAATFLMYVLLFLIASLFADVAAMFLPPKSTSYRPPVNREGSR
jgi:multisubunit Na+/H+ antiporter MnhE subunit